MARVCPVALFETPHALNASAASLDAGSREMHPKRRETWVHVMPV